MWGGYTGAGGKTVTPAEAHAKLTMRLIPGQEPEVAQAAVKAHIERHAPKGVDLAFDYRPGGTRAFTLAADHPLRAAAAAVEASGIASHSSRSTRTTLPPARPSGASGRGR